MTALTVLTALTALRAQGVLAEFGAAGVLSVADVHVATRLGALTGESDERVLLAAALVVRGTRHGSVVLDLRDAAVTITRDVDEDDAGGPLDLHWPEVGEWVAGARAALS